MRHKELGVALGRGAPQEIISFLRLEPLVNIIENRIVGFEVLSVLREGLVPEEWFRGLKSGDIIQVLMFQLERISALLIKERCFYNLSVEALLKISEKDINIITGFKSVSIEISDTRNMKYLDASENVVLLSNLNLLSRGGVGIWLDDFTLDELIYLGLFQGIIDGVKIDKSELRKPWLRKLISAIQNAQEDIDIIVEGVETERDLVVVEESGAKMAQGYLWNVDNFMFDADFLS